MPSAFGKPVTTANRFGVAAAFINKYAILYGDSADGLSGSAWTKRTISGEDYDPSNIVSVASSVFTLGAGTFLITATAEVSTAGSTFYFVGTWQTRIRDTTNGATVILGLSNGNSLYSTDTKGNGTSLCEGTVTTTGSTNFELQHWAVLNNGSISGGRASGAGVGDRYVKITIIQIA